MCVVVFGRERQFYMYAWYCLYHFCRTSDQDVVNVPPPRCAVGVVSLLDHTPPPRSLTCILCQEENKDTGSQEKPFVQAVHIQRSAVLRRVQNEEQGTCTSQEEPFVQAVHIQRSAVPHRGQNEEQGTCTCTN